MRLHRLKLMNFRQHAETELVLGPGITAIIGPNGSGKTTLLEAIAWAFYGNPAARGSRETLRWSRAPARSPVRVEVEFALGAHEFRVVRGLYTAELYQDRGDAPIATSHQEVSARVERLLGMTRGEFFSTYFTGQKELAVMAALGPTERARFLSRVLGYEKLRLAQEKVREARAALRAELAGAERGLPDPAALEREREAAEGRVAAARQAVVQGEGVWADAERRLAGERPTWARMAETRDRVVALEGERRVTERDVLAARRDVERLEPELNAALAARGRLAELAGALERIQPLRAELDRLEAEARRADQRRALAGQLEECTGQIGRVRDRLAHLGDAAEELERAQATLSAERAGLERAEAAEAQARTDWVRDQQDADTMLRNLKEQYRELKQNRDRVVEAGPEGECPVCRRPLGPLYQQMLGTLDAQLEQVEVKGKFFKQRSRQLRDEPAALREAAGRRAACARVVEAALRDVARCEGRVREREGVERELARLEERRAGLERSIAELPDRYAAARHDQVREELRALEPVMSLAAELRVRAGRVDELAAALDGARGALAAAAARVAQLDAAIAELGFSEQQYCEARERYEAAVAAQRAAELALASVRGDLKGAEAALETAIQRHREREERARRVGELRGELRLHDELDSALHDLRLDLNTTMRPELSERASAFLAELTDGRYTELELDERYEVLVIEDGQPKPVISGGEEDIANFVLRLAISQMVAERAGQPLSLLVLDEIFGSLDEHHRHKVVELLRRLADRFPQVVLITHIESVREGVDRVLRVVLDADRGAAVVTEEQPDGEDYVAA